MFSCLSSSLFSLKPKTPHPSFDECGVIGEFKEERILP
jgi:hypothetical protein